MENSSGKWTFSERWNLCFSSYNNHELKARLWWVGACEGKKSSFFTMFILSEGNFLKVCILIPMCSVLNKLSEYIYIYTFTCKKTLLYTYLLLVFKIVESLQCILKNFENFFKQLRNCNRKLCLCPLTKINENSTSILNWNFPW